MPHSPDYRRADFRLPQSVLNSETRLIFYAGVSEHITPFLRDLHWLRASERITSKLATLDASPPVPSRNCTGHLSVDLHRVANVASRRLKFADSAVLTVPRTRLSVVGDRAFQVVAARTWNSLSSQVAYAETHCFQNYLKTHLFPRSFHYTVTERLAFVCTNLL
jgi:hypothetical protein